MKSNLLKFSAFRLAIWGCSLIAFGGCGGPRLSDAEIGQPIFELPKLPGADEPYPMPELDKPADGTEVAPAPAPKASDKPPAPSASPQP